MTALTVVLVGVGGALGSVLRWRLGRLNRVHPVGTFTANMGGSLALGLLVGLDSGLTMSPWVLTVLGGGVLGGLTTFSTLVVETMTPGRSRVRWGYLTLTLVCGVALAAAGQALGVALSS